LATYSFSQRRLGNVVGVGGSAPGGIVGGRLDSTRCLDAWFVVLETSFGRTE
jgi:hypothetical protein